MATFEERPPTDGGVATLPQSARPLAPADLVLPATFPATFGVKVYETSGGPTLVAAVELVSPGNKDREETRRAFAVKCASYLHQALGLIVVDIVTSRLSRPFVDLMTLAYPDRPLPSNSPLLAVSYRPVRVEGVDSLELRLGALAVGQSLPELPLALGGLCWVPLDLKAAYEDAQDRSRL